MRSISVSLDINQYTMAWIVSELPYLVPRLGLLLEVREDIGFIFLLGRFSLQLVEVLLWLCHLIVLTLLWCG